MVLSTEPDLFREKKWSGSIMILPSSNTTQLIGEARIQDCAKSVFAEEQDLSEGMKADKEMKNHGFRPDMNRIICDIVLTGTCPCFQFRRAGSTVYLQKGESLALSYRLGK